jgi:hypothetical protein
LIKLKTEPQRPGHRHNLRGQAVGASEDRVSRSQRPASLITAPATLHPGNRTGAVLKNGV